MSIYTFIYICKINLYIMSYLFINTLYKTEFFLAKNDFGEKFV